MACPPYRRSGISPRFPTRPPGATPSLLATMRPGWPFGHTHLKLVLPIGEHDLRVHLLELHALDLLPAAVPLVRARSTLSHCLGHGAVSRTELPEQRTQHRLQSLCGRLRCRLLLRLQKLLQLLRVDPRHGLH